MKGIIAICSESSPLTHGLVINRAGDVRLKGGFTTNLKEMDLVAQLAASSAYDGHPELITRCLDHTESVIIFSRQLKADLISGRKSM